MEETKVSTKKIASTKGLDIVIVTVLSLIFFLCPIFFTGMVAQGLGFEKLMLFYFLVLIGVVAWVTKGLLMGELSIKRTPLDIPIVGAVIVFIVSTILSVSTKDSLIGSYGNSAKGLVAILVFVLFYYLIVNNLDVKRIRLMFWMLVSSTFLLVVFSLLQLKGIFIIPIDAIKNISFNPMGSLSGLTMFLVSVFPILIVASAQAKEMLPDNPSLVIPAKIIAGITALGSLVILILLNGFTFWPVAIVGAVIVLMFFLSKIIPIGEYNLLIPLAGFIFVVILLVIGNFNFVDLKLPAEVSLSRGASWDIARQSIMENPVFGSGPSTFYYDFAKFKNLDFNNSPLWNIRFDSASGALFEFMSTYGILGVLLIIIIALISFSVTFLTLIKTKERGIDSMLLGLFASFISITLFSLLFAQNNALILMTVILSIFTVAVAMVMYPEKFSELKLSFRASAKFALSLAAIFLCVSAGVVVLFTMGLKMYMADMLAKNVLTTGSVEEKVAALNKAIALAPYQDVYHLSLANSYMALANQAAVGQKDQSIIGNNLSLAIESGKKSVELNKNKADNNEALALIYENASFYTRGALEWSEQYYQAVEKLDPKSPTPALRIALIDMARANAETADTEKKYYIGEAVKKYDEAIKLKGDLAAAYYGKSIADEKLGQLDQAIEELQKANLVARDNLDYRFELGRMYFNRGVTNPKLSQSASKDIAVNDINGTTTPDNISVQPETNSNGTIVMNDDLRTAEQLFLSILTSVPDHANAKYSLAVLYQKTGQNENAKLAVESLLTTIKDEKTIEALKSQFKTILE